MERGRQEQEYCWSGQRNAHTKTTTAATTTENSSNRVKLTFLYSHHPLSSSTLYSASLSLCLSPLSQLDSVRLGALGAPNSASTHTGLDVFESVNGRWTTTGALALQAGAAGAEEPIDFVVAQLKAIIKEDKQRGLSDFDDHLDDVQADWTNAEFTKNVLPTGK